MWCVHIVLYTYSEHICEHLNTKTLYIVSDKLGKREVVDVELEKRLWGAVAGALAGPAIKFVTG